MPDPLNLGIHRPGIPEVVIAPHLIEDSLPIEHLAGMGDQQVEDLHLLGGADDGLSIVEDLILVQIYRELAGPDDGTLAFPLGIVLSPEHRFDTGYHLPGGKGFYDCLLYTSPLP